MAFTREFFLSHFDECFKKESDIAEGSWFAVQGENPEQFKYFDGANHQSRMKFMLHYARKLLSGESEPEPEPAEPEEVVEDDELVFSDDSDDEEVAEVVAEVAEEVVPVAVVADDRLNLTTIRSRFLQIHRLGNRLQVHRKHGEDADGMELIRELTYNDLLASFKFSDFTVYQNGMIQMFFQSRLSCGSVIRTKHYENPELRGRRPFRSTDQMRITYLGATTFTCYFDTETIENPARRGNEGRQPDGTFIPSEIKIKRDLTKIRKSWHFKRLELTSITHIDNVPICDAPIIKAYNSDPNDGGNSEFFKEFPSNYLIKTAISDTDL